MKGVSVLFDESRKKRIVQIDLDVLDKQREAIEDLLDLLVAENRKNDVMVPWADAKALLKKAGKL
jgi:hypothetical protein